MNLRLTGHTLKATAAAVPAAAAQVPVAFWSSEVLTIDGPSGLHAGQTEIQSQRLLPSLCGLLSAETLPFAADFPLLNAREPGSQARLSQDKQINAQIKAQEMTLPGNLQRSHRRHVPQGVPQRA